MLENIRVILVPRGEPLRILASACNENWISLSSDLYLLGIERPVSSISNKVPAEKLSTVIVLLISESSFFIKGSFALGSAEERFRVVTRPWIFS